VDGSEKQSWALLARSAHCSGCFREWTYASLSALCHANWARWLKLPPPCLRIPVPTYQPPGPALLVCRPAIFRKCAHTHNYTQLLQTAHTHTRKHT